MSAVRPKKTQLYEDHHLISFNDLLVQPDDLISAPNVWFTKEGYGPVANRVGMRGWFLLRGILCIYMAVIGLLISAMVNREKKGDPLPEAVSTSVRQAILTKSED